MISKGDGDGDGDGGELRFCLEMSSEGARNLRQRVKAELSLLIGTYTDDVLAEYVVVLVGRGKNQTQAAKDLQAFLGDKSEEFVSWLWEHLKKDIQLYVSEPAPTNSAGCATTVTNSNKALNNTTLGEATETSFQETQPAGVMESCPTSKDFEKETNAKKKGVRNLIVWTEGAMESLPATTVSQRQERPTKRRRSPDTLNQREAEITEEKRSVKRSPLLQMNASRRLLEAAVRQAVTTPPSQAHKAVKVSRKLLESAVRQAIAPPQQQEKRREPRDDTETCLRSTKLMEFEAHEIVDRNGDLLKPFLHPAKREKRPMPAMLVAMKAAVAAAEDVSKCRVRHSSNIWDRLNKTPDETVEVEDQNGDRKGHEMEEKRVKEGQISENEQHRSNLIETKNRKRLRNEDDKTSRRYTRENLGNDSIGRSLVGKEQPYTIADVEDDEAEEGEFRREEAFDNEPYLQENASTIDQSCEESISMQYRKAKDSEKLGNQNNAGVSKLSKENGNISVDIDTEKAPEYGVVKDVVVDEHSMLTLRSNQVRDEMDKVLNVEGSKLSNIRDSEPEKEKDQDALVVRSKAQGETMKQKVKVPEGGKEAQVMSKSSTSGTKQSLEDVDQRSVYVTNIHFAATKESLITHFSQCGEIVRAVMITDGATGMPKGSAYVEFALKIGADRALALSDSPFLSRILKVVRKNGVNTEATPLAMRRAIPIPIRAPMRNMYMRGGGSFLQRRFSNISRPSYITPSGPRPSLQWKRESAGNPHTQAARSFSYVRNAEANVISPSQHAPSEGSGKDPSKDAQEDISIRERVNLG